MLIQRYFLDAGRMQDDHNINIEDYVGITDDASDRQSRSNTNQDGPIGILD